MILLFDPKKLFKYPKESFICRDRLGRLACPVTTNRHYGGVEAEGGAELKAGPDSQRRSSVLQDCWYSETGQALIGAALRYVDGACRSSRAEERIRTTSAW